MRVAARRESILLMHRGLTSEVIGACFEVSTELGHGFVESVYQKALLIALRDKGLSAEPQVQVGVRFRGQSVGEFVADIVVEDCVILEMKAVRALAPEHQAQLINYLNASGLDVGLLVNFGTPRVECCRCHRRGSDVEVETVQTEPTG